MTKSWVWQEVKTFQAGIKTPATEPSGEHVQLHDIDSQEEDSTSDGDAYEEMSATSIEDGHSSGDLSPENYITRLCNHQHVWTKVATNLATLRSSTPVSIWVLDFWCSLQWYHHGEVVPLYIPFSKADPNGEDIEAFRALQGEKSLKSDRAITLGEADGRISVILFDIKNSEIHLIGPDQQPQRSIGISRYRSLVASAWSRVTAYLGSNKNIAFTRERTLSWEGTQGSDDSGVLAVQVVESIWTLGFEKDRAGFWNRPILPCCHQTRYKIVNGVHGALIHALETVPYPETQDFRLTERSVLGSINLHLSRTMQKYCANCISELQEKAGPIQFQETIDCMVQSQYKRAVITCWMRDWAPSVYLTSLAPDALPPLAVMDVFLTLEWNMWGQPCYQYVPTLLPFHGELHKTGSVALCPVVLLMQAEDQSYKTVLFDPSRAFIHILGGGKVNSCHSFINIEALEMWEKVSTLFGWTDNIRWQYRTTLWKDSSSIESGTTACAVMLYIWTEGFQTDKGNYWRRPAHLHCNHGIRQDILDVLQLFTTTEGVTQPGHWCNEDFAQVKLRLDLEADRCQWNHDADDQNIEHMVDPDPIIDNPRPSPSQLQKLVRDRVAAFSCTRGSRNLYATIKNHGKSKTVTERNEGPCVPDHVIDASVTSAVVSNLDDYDDYISGPSMSILDSMHFPSQIFAKDRIYTLYGEVQDTCQWYQDWGWRLVPSFFSGFKSSNPEFVKQHMLAAENISDLPLKPSADQDAPDSHVVGHNELVKICQDPAQLNKDTILSGIIRSEQRTTFAILDLQKEAIPIPKLKAVVDFDSLIWVTRSPKFRGTVNMFWNPQVRGTAQIAKDNHITVTLLIPRSDEDAATPGRDEWWIKRFSLSNIPHALFARVDLFVLIIFFPRMAHQKTINNRRYWCSVIPMYELEVFYSRVVQPATQALKSDSYMLYAPTDKEHRAYKARGTDRHTVPLDPELFDRLVDTMNKIISEDSELSRFGSLFFVLEGKGFKLHTLGDSIPKPGLLGQLKQAVRTMWSESAESSAEQALQNLHNRFPYLDWAYMSDRMMGELYVDVAFTYTPEASPMPVVGLWHLPFLERSFHRAGYKKGTTHHASMLGGYGSQQAEMRQNRQEVTHIINRLSYNQIWEVARRNDNKRDLITPLQAYNCGPDYIATARTLIDVLYGDRTPRTHTYGVRDEFRIGYQAVASVVRNAEEIVNQMNKQRKAAILWISTASWFSFLQCRLTALLEFQIELSCRRYPDNLGEITGLLTYLMEAVNYTPFRQSVHVQSALKELLAPEIQRGFGMFFIHELDRSKANPIDSLPETDSAAVLADLGVKKAKKIKKSDRSAPIANHNLYPLGEYPAIAKVLKTIQTCPWNLIAPWQSPRAVFELSEGVSALFCRFTRDVWLVLNSPHRNITEINQPPSIDAALQMWSLEFVHETIIDASFHAVTTGIEGKGPRVGVPFRDRVAVWFPSIDNVPDTPVWKLFMAHGYLRSYHELTEMNDDVDQQLSNLLMLCQCLPVSSTGSHRPAMWTRAGQGVAVDTNPHYYRLKGAHENDTTGTEVKSRAPQTQTPVTELVRLLDGNPQSAKRARKIQKRGAKARNARNPPNNRYHQATLSTDTIHDD